MGDRGNVCIEYSRGQDDEARRIWFYTHWRGEGMPVAVRDALAKKWRWGDEGYLARIIFDTLSAGEHDVETGFAITPEPYDTPHPYIIVDMARQRVSFVREQDWDDGWKGDVDSFLWSFQEFADLTDKELASYWKVASGFED